MPTALTCRGSFEEPGPSISPSIHIHTITLASRVLRWRDGEDGGAVRRAPSFECLSCSLMLLMKAFEFCFRSRARDASSVGPRESRCIGRTRKEAKTSKNCKFFFVYSRFFTVNRGISWFLKYDTGTIIMLLLLIQA